jgi:ribonuclease P protein component
LKRYGLSAKERIKSKKDFDKIFSSGKILYSSSKLIRAVYIVEKEDKNKGVRIAVAVGKKLGIAVWRNRIKRLIKESYRLNKEILLEICSKNNILLKIVFSPNSLNEKKNKNIMLIDLMPSMVDLMTKLRSLL